MRTSVTLDDDTVDDLMKVTGAANRTRAVQIAVVEYLRKEKLERLRQLKGKVAIASNDELEAAELEALETLGG